MERGARIGVGSRRLVGNLSERDLHNQLPG
jgi:hypothetical protein